MAIDPNKTPEDFQESPTDLSPGAGQTRLIVRAVQDSLRDVRADVQTIRSGAHSDFRLLLKIFGTAFVILAGMLIFGYFRLEDKITALTASSIRVDTKLEDLLQRNPPIPTPLKR
jgi:hypothetical protein